MRPSGAVAVGFDQSGSSSIQVAYAELVKLGIPLGSLGPTRERALARLRRDDQLVAAR